MKIVRTGTAPHERFGVLHPDGTIYDVDDIVSEGSLYADGVLDAIRSQLPARTAGQIHSARRGSPIPRPGKIICIGLNYRRHAAEAGMPVPAEPILFMKAPDTIVGPDDVVHVPPGSSKTDYEVELGVVIGRTARYLGMDDEPLDYVFGYVAANDVSEREYQLERGGQWDKGKNCETFSPLGPYLVTADEIPDPQTLTLRSTVNGQVRQDSTTADMIFPVRELIRYVSQFMVLYPGDLILTGTPEGVGSGFTPPRYLTAGDVMEISIDQLGTQRQTLRHAPENGNPS